MNLKNLLQLFFFSCVLSGSTYAQSSKYFISPPTDLKEVGWNKVLCMKNGNTLLFHFEPGKRIILNVYDSTHKQIAHQEHLTRYVDLHILKDAIFKGLYDVSNEVVLFLEQEHLGQKQLLRLRFNGTDGSMIEENMLGEPQNITKHTTFSVMKNKEQDNYAILFSTDAPQYLDCKIAVSFYNKKSELIKEIPLNVDRKAFDYLKVVGAEAQPNGMCITLALAKLQLNGTSHGTSLAPGDAAVYGHDVAIYYIPTNSDTAIMKMIDVGTDFFAYYSNYTYNSFSKTLNLLLFSYKPVSYRYGLEWRPSALTADLFIKLDESTLDLSHNWINDKFANELLKKSTDTGRIYQGIPVKMFTNENGLSTLVSESYSIYGERENPKRVDHNSYFGNISITQFDDDGNEIWGTLLPNSQYLKSYSRYYPPGQTAKKWQGQYIFGDLPPQVYDRQFVTLNTYFKDRDLYIVYNDNNENFNNSIEKPGDTVFQSKYTNAVYYKMNRKKEVTKHYVYGEPKAKEYIASFIEGADFDEQRGVYASLVQCWKNDQVTLCMAWSHLDQ
jgi:hypothetical protein